MLSDMQDVLLSTSQYRKHVESLHELEMFYGDTTLQALIQHSSDLLVELEDYVYRYSYSPLEEPFFNNKEDFDGETGSQTPPPTQAL